VDNREMPSRAGISSRRGTVLGKPSGRPSASVRVRTLRYVRPDGRLTTGLRASVRPPDLRSADVRTFEILSNHYALLGNGCRERSKPVTRRHSVLVEYIGTPLQIVHARPWRFPNSISYPNLPVELVPGLRRRSSLASDRACWYSATP
jgi:hypothetical protein